MLTNRLRITSVCLPVALIVFISALALFPIDASAQCPTFTGDEIATAGITRFQNPNAQMWYNDGIWWGVFSDNFNGIYLYSFSTTGTTQGPIVDGNVLGSPDVLWDGTNLFVLVWKSLALTTLYKYSYDSATKTYTLLTGFPVNMPIANGSPPAVLEKDSTGKLWATYTSTNGGGSDGKLHVMWSTSADQKVWDTTGTILETGFLPTYMEVTSIIHFGGNKIGVVWSNFPGKEIGFRYHIDGQPESSWSAKELVDSGLGPLGLGSVADDHLSIKAAPDGRVFLVAKDNDNDGTIAHAHEGRLWLYIRSAAGVWGQKTIVQPDFSQLPTRPILLLDTTHNEAYVIYHDETTPGRSGGGRNFITHSSMVTPSFDFPCVITPTPSSNPVSTKQNVTPAMGIMMASSTGATGSNEVILRGVDLNINPLPIITSLSPSTASAGGAAFTLTINGTGFVPTSVAQWDGVDRVTTFVNATALTIPVTAADISAAGTALVTVTSPAPGGGTSDPSVFTINAAPTGYESDVAPRPNGSNNGSVSIADWVQTGRFASGLDTPNPGSELQRADSAPKGTCGNGVITISDWVQAGRYASGLDPVVSACGPTGLAPIPLGKSTLGSVNPSTASARTIYVATTSVNAGQPASISIELDSQGDENSLGFSVNFNTSQLTFVSAALGSDATGASPFFNTVSANLGRVGIAVGLPSGQTFAAGTRQLLTLNFNVAANASGSTSITFGDQPIAREIVNVTADVLTASYPPATLTIVGANNPVPGVTSISPTSLNAGGAGFTLTVNGSNFINGSVVRWNGADRSTTFSNSGQLTAQISAADIASSGNATVTVFNPAPGGGTSGSIGFTINAINPVPAMSGLSPTGVIAGSGAFTLTVNGSNFINGSVVRWNGADRSTTFGNSGQLTAQISAADIASAGSAAVTVFNPAPGGGTSGSMSFTINASNPVPAISGLSPTGVIAGSGAFTLTVDGSNFINGSIVRWNGADRSTAFGNSGQLTAQISAADIASAGNATVTVFNPAPGGGTSGSLSFAINAPQTDPPKFQFSAQSFNASEGAGSAVITVTRSGDASAAASVDFGINDPIGYAPCLVANGVAAQNCDYIITAGTLQFAAGEATKTFSIPLVDDVNMEGNETLNLKLANPVGASLGTVDTASLTIVDNDSGPPTSNPIDEAQFFVRQHYLDFLNREPDAGGLGYWSSQISECGTDEACVRNHRIGVSGAFFVELEFQETGYVVYRMHRAAFGTWPNAPSRANVTYAQFMPDRSQLVGGPQLQASTIEFANRFVLRPEFKSVYSDAMTPAGFVNKLFDSAGLMNNPGQRQQAIDALSSGAKSRSQVLLDLIETPEFKQREYNPSFVLMQYYGYLRRDPEQEGYDFWLNVLNNREPNNYRGMICSFLTSGEYQQRFSSIVTRSNSQCGQ